MVNPVDIHFRNLEVKRFTNMIEGPVNIHNNSNIKAVSKIEGRLAIDFAFTCTYEPGIGLVRIEGDMMITDSEQNIDRAIKEWEKAGKNLPMDIAEKVHNTILSSCIVQSVILTKDVGLPAPIPTPTISMAKKGGTEVKPAENSSTQSYIR